MYTMILRRVSFRDAKFSKRSHPGERLAFTRVIHRSILRRLFTNTTEVKPDDSTGERVSCVFYLFTGFTKERVRKRAPESVLPHVQIYLESTDFFLIFWYRFCTVQITDFCDKLQIS